MIALSNIIGPLFMVALVGLPIWLQIEGHSPFWLIPFAFLYNVFWLPLDRRAAFHATAQEMHGDNAQYVTLVRPIFTALGTGLFIYVVTFALRRWVF